MGRTASEIQKLLGSDSGSCSVCRFVTIRMQGHIDKLFYERVLDIPTREAIRRARGFCRPHAGMVSRHADALGTAIIMKDVVTNELRALDGGQLDKPPNTGRGIRGLLGSVTWNREPRPPCPLCDVQGEMDALAVDDLLTGLKDSTFAKNFCQSGGLCLPHFHLAFERSKDVAPWKIVLETQRAALAELVDELSELARKFDYRFQDEPRGEESDSWRRALRTTSGNYEE